MKKPDAKKSLCWTCKFGLCVQEKEQANLAYIDSEVGHTEDNDEYGLGIDNLLGDSSPDPAELREHVVEHERVKTICFYRNDNRDTPIVAMSHILKCNRYQNENN